MLFVCLFVCLSVGRWVGGLVGWWDGGLVGRWASGSGSVGRSVGLLVGDYFTERRVRVVNILVSF